MLINHQRTEPLNQQATKITKGRAQVRTLQLLKVRKIQRIWLNLQLANQDLMKNIKIRLINSKSSMIDMDQGLVLYLILVIQTIQ